MNTELAIAKDSEMFGIDLLITAVEGGINHWARAYAVERVRLAGWNYEALRVINVAATDSRGVHQVKANQLRGAARKVLEIYPDSVHADSIRDALRDDDASYIDAHGADMIIQVLCFGELVYS